MLDDKAINTHLQYVILTAFTRQKWFREGVSVLRRYVIIFRTAAQVTLFSIEAKFELLQFYLLTYSMEQSPS